MRNKQKIINNVNNNNSNKEKNDLSKNQVINSLFISSQNQHQNIQLNSMDENASDSSEKQQSNKNQQFFTQSQIRFQKLKYSQKNMLIVMCHGFQGSSYDMTCLHKAIKSCLPQAYFLLSRKNEDDTEGNIQQMGEKLADEIKYYIRAYMNQQTVIINLVGHSMGGIITRASLKYLLKFKDQFGFFCSLSSPHIGYLNGVDNKIKAGLWVLRKWKPIKSLDQLAMEDNKKLRETFLYKLSRQGTLKYFRKIIFFSSFEDSYVSWHSARVSAHNNKNSQSKIQQQMVNNILGLSHGINKQTTIHRLDINFNVKGNNIDSLIGRAAHINLIVQETFFDVINTCIPQLFSLKEYGTGLER